MSWIQSLFLWISIMFALALWTISSCCCALLYSSIFNLRPRPASKSLNELWNELWAGWHKNRVSVDRGKGRNGEMGSKDLRKENVGIRERESDYMLERGKKKDSFGANLFSCIGEMCNIVRVLRRHSFQFHLAKHKGRKVQARVYSFFLPFPQESDTHGLCKHNRLSMRRVSVRWPNSENYETFSPIRVNLKRHW